MKVDIFPFFKKCTGTCFSFFLSHTATAQNRFIFTGSGRLRLHNTEPVLGCHRKMGFSLSFGRHRKMGFGLSLVVTVRWDLACSLVVTIRWDLACPWSSL